MRSSKYLSLGQARKKLVGGPALGVPGGILEVDSAGVVGEVFEVDYRKYGIESSDEESRVNRRVDEASSSKHTLSCCSMFDMHNRLIGVFEAINHAEFLFDDHTDWF